MRDTDIVARWRRSSRFCCPIPTKAVCGRWRRRSRGGGRFAQRTETDITLKVTVSIGVSVFRGNRREFFNAADRALYKSKAAGKNCVHYALA